MKKVLAIVLSLVLVFSVSFALVACTPDEDDGHEHTYKTTLSKDDDYHWYDTTCGHTDAIKDKVAHSYSWSTTTPATCTTAGEKLGTCVCGATKTDTIPALTHSYGKWTPNGDGTHSRVCGNDNKHTETDDCDYTVSVIDPTCTEDGYTLHKCKDCGDEVKDTPVGKTGHNYVGGVCQNCDDVDETQISDAELIAALEENYKEGIVSRALYGITINMSNVSTKGWYIITDNDGKITKVEYAFVYSGTATSHYLMISSIEFDTSIDKKDIVNGDVSAIYKNYNAVDYSINYNPTIQETRGELTEALLKTCIGGELTEGSIRILVDKGGITDNTLGTVRNFIAAEITENGVQEYSVLIKTASNDAGYIANLNSTSNYRIASQKSYELIGTKLMAE